MKYLLTSAAAAALILGAGAASAQTVPAATVIIVDMDQVILNSAAGKAASTELKTKSDALQARATSLQTQFGNEEQALAKSQPAQGAAPAVITEFQAKARDYSSRRQAAEAEINNRSRDFQASRQYVIKQIQDGANPVISTIMRERGASIVMAEGATLQHSASIDVTADVTARLDRSLPRVSTVAPAAPK